MRLKFFLLLAAAACAVGCKTSDPSKLSGETHYYVPERDRDAAPPLDSSKFPKVTRAECLALAEKYVHHEWNPTARNAFHGADPEGIRVDTPDSSFNPEGVVPGWWVPGLVNRGIPYQWGGFSTLEEFDAGIASGKYAGDIYTSQKRKMLDDAVSKHAVGVDCSGFVSRCWKLPRSHSTRELPGLCLELKNWDDLQPGDILNTRNEHVLLFARWNVPDRSSLVVFETGSPPTWKVLHHALLRKPLADWGYRAYRYRNMTE